MSASKILNALLRIAWTGKIGEKPCTYLDQIQDVEASMEVWEECAQLGDTWVQTHCSHPVDGAEPYVNQRERRLFR